MERLIKIGEISQKNSKDIKFSKIGLGFEKLDRDAFDPSKCYDKISALGVKWARIQSGWAKTEKEKGVYDFSWLDAIVNSLIEHGLKPWMCLCYGNGLYSDLAAQTFGCVGVPPINTSEAEKAWENYVKATVKHYEGRIDTFEIWNEPDGIWCWKTGVNATELGIFTSKTSRYIKEVNKDAYVIGGVMCEKQLTYLNEALKAGLADNLDAISFHEYTPDESSVCQTVASYKSLASAYGKELEIIQGESGSQSRSGGCGAVHTGAWTQLKQAKQLLRHAVADLSADVKFTSYFSCMDMFEALNGTVDNPDSYKDFGYFGVLGADFDEDGHATGTYTPKLSYRALQVIASLFCEDLHLYDVPVIMHPEYSPRVFENDANILNIKYQGFRKDNGSYAFVYWSPTNIMTTDYESTISLEIACFDNKPKIVDLMDGSIYEMPEAMYEKDDFGTYRISHLPIKDYPMMIMCGNFE